MNIDLLRELIKRSRSMADLLETEVSIHITKDTVIRVKRNYINYSVRGEHPTPPWLLKLPSFILNNDSLSSSNVVLPVVQICVNPG